MSVMGFFIAILLAANAGVCVNAQPSAEPEVTEIGSFETGAYAADVHVQNDVAFVAATDALYILDVSDPASPALLSQYSVDDHVHQIHVDGNLVYMADYTEGFKILNVTDPENPSLLGELNDGGEVGTFRIVGDLAFIPDFEDGLEIVNISDPAHPTELSQYDTGISFLFSIEIHNNLAYVSDYVSASEKLVRVLDVSDLANIEEIANYTIDGEVFSIAFVGDLAYMMCSYGGVRVFNISDPLSVAEVGSYDDGGHAVDCGFIEGYLVIADAEDGVEFLDITDSAHPNESLAYFDGGSARNVEVVNDLIFVGDGEDGLEILRFVVPSGATDLSGYILVVGILGVIVIVALVGLRLRRK